MKRIIAIMASSLIASIGYASAATLKSAITIYGTATQQLYSKPFQVNQYFPITESPDALAQLILTNKPNESHPTPASTAHGIYRIFDPANQTFIIASSSALPKNMPPLTYYLAGQYATTSKTWINNVKLTILMAQDHINIDADKARTFTTNSFDSAIYFPGDHGTLIGLTASNSDNGPTLSAIYTANTSGIKSFKLSGTWPHPGTFDYTLTPQIKSGSGDGYKPITITVNANAGNASFQCPMQFSDLNASRGTTIINTTSVGQMQWSAALTSEHYPTIALNFTAPAYWGFGLAPSASYNAAPSANLTQVTIAKNRQSVICTYTGINGLQSQLTAPGPSYGFSFNRNLNIFNCTPSANNDYCQFSNLYNDSSTP